MVTAQWHDDAWYTDVGGTAGRSGVPTGQVGIPRPLIGSVIDTNGIDQFGIVETPIETADGAATVDLAVSFTPPGRPAPSAAATPLIGLSPVVSTTGGTITGGQNLYYAVTGVDAHGTESGLSFVVKANVPSGTNTNAVQITSLSFSPATAGFDVYRGANPSALFRIASNVATAATYTDSGATALLQGPPDPNYDHANFYWRWELSPEAVVNSATTTTISNTALGMTPDSFQNALVRITRGTGAGQERVITANDATTITVIPPWTVAPDTTSYFTVAEATWTFGSVATASPAHVQVPNQGGADVEVSGRSANALDQESPYALNPLTSWEIGEGTSTDGGIPPLPSFTLSAGGQGTVLLTDVTFPTLVNTHTITAGSLTMFYWDELLSPTTVTLAAGVSATDTTLTLSAVSTTQVDDIVQIETELVFVTAIASGGLSLTVTRGFHSSTAASHLAGALVYPLKRKDLAIPFVTGFFGTAASLSYAYSTYLPDARIGAAEFYALNAIGNGPTDLLSYTTLTDGGIRTMAGGQITLQVEGYLGVQTDAVPPYVMESTYAIRDVSAVLLQAPSGGNVTVQVRLDSTVFATLTITNGLTASNIVDGFGLAPLTAGSKIHLDVTSLPGGATSLPGQGLTVTIRL